MSVKVVDESVSVTSEPVRVESEAVPATVKITDQATAIVSSQDYIVTTSAAAGYANGGMPDWLTKSIDIALSNGYADQEQVIHDLSVLIAGIEKGVHQSISNIETEVLSQNTKIDTVKSELDGNSAAILNVETTLVDDYSSTAETATIMGSAFDSNNAYILGESRTIATDEIAASYEATGLLSTVTDPDTGVTSLATSRGITYSSVGMNTDGSMNGTAGFWGQHAAKIGELEVSITNMSGATAGQFENFTGTQIEWNERNPEDRQIGTLRVETNGTVVDQYMGTISGWTGEWSGWETTTLTPGEAVSGWAASAATFATGDQGQITGWGFSDGSATDSQFTIAADTFQIYSSTGGKPIFDLSTTAGKLKMTSDVEIDGNLNILDGTITSASINTVGLIAENIESTSIIYGNIIEGSVINGASINGSVIKASYLDLDGDLEVLTNYHISYAMYSANPALYTDAVDTGIEYRIPSLSRISIPATSINANVYNYTWNCNIKTYDYGNAGNNRKAVRINPAINFGSGSITAKMVGSFNIYAHDHIAIYLGATLLCKVELTSGSSNQVFTVTSDYINTTVLGTVYETSTLVINGCTVEMLFESGSVASFTVTVSGNPTPVNLSGAASLIQIYTQAASAGTHYITIPTNVIFIDNMI